MASLLKPWVVRYLDDDGRQVAKGTPGARKVRERTPKWYGQYVDVDGKRRRVPLCTDKTAARQMLAKLEREVQLGKAGVVDPYANHRKAPILDHIEEYLASVRGNEVTDRHLATIRRHILAVVNACEARALGDMQPEGVERFLATLAEKGTGSSTRNQYLGAVKAFIKWCLKTRRLGEDVLASLTRSTGAIRRRRRALTDAELGRLLTAAQERPLHEVIRIKRGPRQGQLDSRIHPERRAHWERVGWEHALIYKMLVHTGLRRGELEALEVRHLTLDGARPCLLLPGAETKNGEEADLPLRGDLVDDLKRWLQATGKSGTDRVFQIGEELIKVLKKDLKWAGIPYRDAQGRVVDVHALRHTTASHLARGKVSPRVAQKFMRHADVRLTLETYTDSDLLDEGEALAALPDLPLRGNVTSKAEDDP